MQEHTVDKNFEPRHEVSNNVVCATSKASDQPAHYAQSDQSLCLSLEYYMTVKLQIEHHLDFLSLTGAEATFVKMSHCLKSHRGSNEGELIKKTAR